MKVHFSVRLFLDFFYFCEVSIIIPIPVFITVCKKVHTVKKIQYFSYIGCKLMFLGLEMFYGVFSKFELTY